MKDFFYKKRNRRRELLRYTYGFSEMGAVILLLVHIYCNIQQQTGNFTMLLGFYRCIHQGWRDLMRYLRSSANRCSQQCRRSISDLAVLLEIDSISYSFYMYIQYILFHNIIASTLLIELNVNINFPIESLIYWRRFSQVTVFASYESISHCLLTNSCLWIILSVIYRRNSDFQIVCELPVGICIANYTHSIRKDRQLQLISEA